MHYSGSFEGGVGDDEKLGRLKTAIRQYPDREMLENLNLALADYGEKLETEQAIGTDLEVESSGT